MKHPNYRTLEELTQLQEQQSRLRQMRCVWGRTGDLSQATLWEAVDEGRRRYRGKPDDMPMEFGFFQGAAWAYNRMLGGGVYHPYQPW